MVSAWKSLNVCPGYLCSRIYEAEYSLGPASDTLLSVTVSRSAAFGECGCVGCDAEDTASVPAWSVGWLENSIFFSLTEIEGMVIKLFVWHGEYFEDFILTLFTQRVI